MNLEHQLLEISNQFSIKEDINYLFRYFCKTCNIPCHMSILDDLISGLDQESIEHVKSFFIKKIIVSSGKYSNLIENRPLDILNLIIPESNKELVNHPQRFFYDSDFLDKQEKYNFESIYSLVGLDTGIKFLPDNVLSRINEGSVIDGGALDAQTAIMYSTYNPKKIYAFEPVRSHVETMKKNINNLNLSHMIETLPYGLSDKDEKFILNNSDLGGGVSLRGKSQNTDQVADDEYIVEATSVDNFVAKNSIGKISLIKLDLEGFEQKAIEGMKDTIIKDKPLLLICIYHTNDDFLKIKTIIDNMNLGYKFKIRDIDPVFYNHPIQPAAEKDLYAWDYMLCAW